MTDDYSEPKSLEQCIAALPDDKYLELQKLLPGLPSRDHIIACNVTVCGEHIILQYSKPVESMRMTSEAATGIAFELLDRVHWLKNSKEADEPHVESPKEELTT